ncbi:hypothetical protein [Sedimenticola selenatireducens]|uniref:hypothetical protein n=1 Tax=Sedimenticola selenatireducens TaxID=191960 RepID=UPI0004B6142D|nr:hypothetical protein [Sedimenticola selenatireducens]
MNLSPPKPGVSLGWRLALLMVLIVSFVMGGISISQQLFELKKNREMHQELLKISLTPLAVRLEEAVNMVDVEREINKFHSAYARKGYPAHEVVLRDETGEKIVSTLGSEIVDDDAGYIRAEIPIASPLFEEGQGTLVVLKSIVEYNDALRRSWLLWAAHFGATVSVTFLFIIIAIYFQVTKPINRLVRGVRKMEKGYGKPVYLDTGAWEIRLLAWRFGSMVQEMQITMTHLLEAEQKARTMMIKMEDSSLEIDQEQKLETAKPDFGQTESPEYRALLTVCERLEHESPDYFGAAKIGREIWQKEALEANRLGFHNLRARLEDTALRLMEPDAYRTLDDSIRKMKAAWQEWAEQYRDVLYHLLEEKAIPCADVLFRVKHTAGVWAKMQSKGITLDEIHDLFAFRIVVPTEADCYAALGVIHHSCKPIISRFKDYIARPKANGYRSLHTCIITNDGPIIEVQIRSVTMDYQAERGDAAHWLYKKDVRELDRTPVALLWWKRVRQMIGISVLHD